MKEVASKRKQDNTTHHIILVNVDSRRGDLGEWSILSYTPIKGYHTVVLGDVLRIDGYRQRVGLVFGTLLLVDSRL